ncbi:UvrB/UvrC motif-containing protein [Candidatus Sumerlaeota bacterium]|nr:UvrB/UvrC motif-containing protein [Candidatus Sumerlaeota bacterium]
MSGFHRFLELGLPLGRIKGIRISLHWTLLLFAVIGAFQVGSFATALFVYAIVFGSVLLHELGHCYGARLVGGGATSIILWPLGGMALVYGAEKDPKSDFIVTALGPAVSVALALLGWAVYGIMLTAQVYVPYVFEFFLFLAWINTILALFNLLLPLFPMDSARLVRAALSFHFEPRWITHHLCTFGMYLGGGLLAVTLLIPGLLPGGNMIGLIGLFGAFACHQERIRARMSPIYENEYFFYNMDNPGFFAWIRQSWRGMFRRPVSAKKREKARVINFEAEYRSDDPVDRLRREMSQAVAREDFREAQRIKAEIERLTKQQR